MNLEKLKELGKAIPSDHFESLKQYEDLLESLGDTVDALDDVIGCLDEFNITEVNEIKATLKELCHLIHDCYDSVDYIDVDVKYELNKAIQDEKSHIAGIEQDYWNSRL